MRGPAARLRPRAAAHFFFGSGGTSRGTHMRAVDAPQVPVDLPFAIQANLHRLKHAVEHAAPTPVAVVVKDRLTRTETLGQITPGCAGSQDPHDPVEHLPRVRGWPTGAGMLLGNQRLHHHPLLIRELMSMHRQPPVDDSVITSFRSFQTEPSYPLSGGP